MPDDGIISSITSGIGQALPYAIPAALGAAMGGVGGAAAGIGEAGAANQEAQNQRADLALKWQELGLEQKKMQIALRDDQQWQDYTQGLPKDEQALARKDPQGYADYRLQAGNWQNTVATLKGDPEFAASLGVKPGFVNSLAALDPKHGEAVLGKYMEIAQSGKFPNGVHGPYKASDGTYYMLGLGADGSGTKIKVDEPVQTMIGTESLGIRQEAVDVSKANAQEKIGDTLSKYLTDRPLPSGSSLGLWENKGRHQEAVDFLVAQGYPRDKAEAQVQAVIPVGSGRKASLASRPKAPAPSADTSGAPKGYRPSSKKGPNGETLYENPMAPAGKRYWVAD